MFYFHTFVLQKYNEEKTVWSQEDFKKSGQPESFKDRELARENKPRFWETQGKREKYIRVSASYCQTNFVKNNIVIY